jgi:ribosomal protein S18 acetylase RimI-like enzyme
MCEGVMSIRIRRAIPGDIENIISLAVEMVIYSLSPMRSISHDDVRAFRLRDIQTVREALTLPTVGIFVAEEDNGAFVGHVIVVVGNQESSTGESQGWIFDLSIKDDYWNRGIGTLLMDEAEKFVIQMGYRYLGLGVTTSNARALRFYEGLGYREERKRMLKVLTPSMVGPTETQG